MLVLSRKVGEELVLPEFGIRITLLAVAGQRARIGVLAPREVRVVRGEVPPLPDSTSDSGQSSDRPMHR